MLPDIKKVMDGLHNEMVLINMDQKDYQMDHAINKYLNSLYPQERIFKHGINQTKFPDLFLLSYFVHRNPSCMDLCIGNIKEITREYQYEDDGMAPTIRVQFCFNFDKGDDIPFGSGGMSFVKIRDLLDGHQEG